MSRNEIFEEPWNMEEMELNDNYRAVPFGEEPNQEEEEDAYQYISEFENEEVEDRRYEERWNMNDMKQEDDQPVIITAEEVGQRKERGDMDQFSKEAMVENDDLEFEEQWEIEEEDQDDDNWIFDTAEEFDVDAWKDEDIEEEIEFFEQERRLASFADQQANEREGRAENFAADTSGEREDDPFFASILDKSKAFQQFSKPAAQGIFPQKKDVSSHSLSDVNELSFRQTTRRKSNFASLADVPKKTKQGRLEVVRARQNMIPERGIEDRAFDQVERSPSDLDKLSIMQRKRSKFSVLADVPAKRKENRRANEVMADISPENKIEEIQVATLDIPDPPDFQ